MPTCVNCNRESLPDHFLCPECKRKRDEAEKDNGLRPFGGWSNG